MDKLIEITGDRIEEITKTNVYKYIDKIIKSLINEQTISKINLSCISNKQVKLSHRKLFFYDILQQINIKINSILTISPSFWFSKMDVKEKTDFIFSYELYLCSVLSFVNLIYDTNKNRVQSGQFDFPLKWQSELCFKLQNNK